MTQAYEVRLLDAGPNLVPVVTRIRARLGISPERGRSLVREGNLVVDINLDRETALGLAEDLRRLGATAEIAICRCGCYDGPDHLHRPGPP